jgi:hypothetical protein
MACTQLRMGASHLYGRRKGSMVAPCTLASGVWFDDDPDQHD